MLAVVHRDVDRARAALRDYHDRGLTDEQKAAADLVIDHNADETRCPACLATFAPAQLTRGDERCPDCGLFLGA